VIEDLEGATSEPVRRWHVFAISLATAAVAVALFVALVAAPAEVDGLPRVSAPPSRGTMSPLVIAAPQLSILSNIDQMRQRACALAPAGIQWMVLSGPAAGARAVRPPSIAVAIDAGTGRPIPVEDRVGEATRWMTVTCDTPDVWAPRVDLKTTPR